ncbi:hypothetical protein [Agaribacterium haliotis]|uniref:hypothetical protein n=1 Tax=Agaribacterium haliotis TaxID=2013869 RepID=UPI000BB54253|nr:hypothetical protein [Agaribacterium haliotis]
MGALIPRTIARLALGAVLASSTVSYAREEPLTAVADLRYGVALYHYHLDDYMAALSELLVAEKKGGIGGHGDNPKIMEAGLAMGYHMEGYASELFNEVLDEDISDEVRNAAWFYLARIRYNLSDWSGSSEAIAQLDKELDAFVRDDVNALRVNLLLQEGDAEAANRLLQKSKLDKRWLPYFWFNLGSALAREGSYRRAAGFFENLARDKYAEEQYRALYDKAMTAAGYCYIFLEEYEAAAERFLKVRLTSTLANRAMLGYGWATIELGQYSETLKAWTHLSNSALIDENNQEAMIAVPYVYEQIGNTVKALEAYEKASESFTREIRKIEEVRVSLDADEMLTALNVGPGEELDWLRLAEEQNLSPNLTYLIRMFARAEFQTSVMQLRDLLYLKRHLNDWHAKLDFYLSMLAAREQKRGARVRQAELEQQQQNYSRLRQSHADLERIVSAIKTEQNWQALANDDEKALFERVERGQQRVELLREEDPFVDEYDEALRRYRGLLLWQASEQFSERYWQLEKALLQAEAQLVEAQQKEKSVQELLNSAADLQPKQLGLVSGQKDIAALIARIDSTIVKAEEALREDIHAELALQQERLSNYLAMSELSIARVHDAALQQQMKLDLEANEREQQRLKDENKTKKVSRQPALLAAPTLTKKSLAEEADAEPKLEQAAEAADTTESEATEAARDVDSSDDKEQSQ